MLKNILLLTLFLISCANKGDDNKLDKRGDNKQENQIISLHHQLKKIILKTTKYRNTEIFTLKGKMKEIENSILPTGVISKNMIKDFKEENEEMLKLAKIYFLGFKKNLPKISNKAILDTLKKYLRETLEEIKEGRIKENIKNENLYIFSFVIDTYLISKNLGFNIIFEEYVKAFMEEIKVFIDKNSKKEVYFSVYNTPTGKYEEAFIKIIEEVFN